MGRKFVVLDISKSCLRETEKAFSVALMNGTTGREAGRAWFPKSQCEIFHPEDNGCPNRMRVIIPMWLALKKTSFPQFIEGYESILET